MTRDSFTEKADIARGKLEGIRIVGVEGAVISDVDALLGDLSRLGSFQPMDASLILDEEHVKFACFEALRSFETGENLTGSLAMEVLVKAACTTQISEAIRRLGAKVGRGDVVLVGIDAGDDLVEGALSLLGGRESSKPLESSPEKRERIAREHSLNEPLEKSLLEKIALTALG
jgi:tRNA threonylcarbamoyladenosine modification (KEOPS) complex Cgi121 subunit